MAQKKGKLGLSTTQCSAYLKPGRNIIGLKLKPNIKGSAIIASLLDDNEKVITVTQADGNWRYSLNQPSDDWLLPEYDDNDWLPMNRGNFGRIEITGTTAQYNWEKASHEPAEIIAPAGKLLSFLSRKPIWIRHAFEVVIEEK